jgi:hypothetical protein
MSTETKCISVNISRENNGVVKIEPIPNITKMRVSSIMFKHGQRKKTKAKDKKKKKKTDDSDSGDEESRYENGNEDLMESIYMDLLVNNFRRGVVYYYDGTIVEDSEYTVRIPLDLEYDGTADYYKSDGYDWELSLKEQPHTIDEVNIRVGTDTLADPKCYDMLVELEFVILVA